MDLCEYLVSHGSQGDFGRFRPTRPLSCRRSDRVVVHSHRGIELGTVLCPATPGHARFLPNTSVGQLLRQATAEDERTARRMNERADLLFRDSCRLASEMELPLEILDVEVLLDGRQAIIHHLLVTACDVRPFVSSLSRQVDLLIALHNLALPKPEPEEEVDQHGCGRPGCGRTEGGRGCGSAAGCSTCSLVQASGVQAYFAGLREKMHQAGRLLPR